jgi:hypothetical protein
LIRSVRAEDREEEKEVTMNQGVNELQGNGGIIPPERRNDGRNHTVKRVAELLSVAFHPIFMPLYGLLIIYSSHTLHSFMPSEIKRMIFILVAANNVMIPLALATVLYARGAISTFNARDRNERMILLTFSVVMYSITAFLLMRMQIPSLFRAYFISIAIVTLITLVITVFYRISLHASGIGGLLVLIVFMILLYQNSMVWQLVAVFVTGGAVMASRIHLEDHSTSEVWTGLLAGVATMSISLFLLLR